MATKRAMLNLASCSQVMTQYYDETANGADCSESGPMQCTAGVIHLAAEDRRREVTESPKLNSQ